MVNIQLAYFHEGSKLLQWDIISKEDFNTLTATGTVTVDPYVFTMVQPFDFSMFGKDAEVEDLLRSKGLYPPPDPNVPAIKLVLYPSGGGFQFFTEPPNVLWNRAAEFSSASVKPLEQKDAFIEWMRGGTTGELIIDDRTVALAPEPEPEPEP